MVSKSAKSDMKKILHVNTVFSGGGAAKIARQLFEYMNTCSGVEGYFAYGRGKEGSERNTFKFGFWFETLVHIALVRILGIDGHGSYFSTRRLIAYIKKNEFDLIHLHNIHGYYLNYRQLFKFLEQTGVPVVWTLHDEWILTWLPAHSAGCLHCLTGEGRCVNEYRYPKTSNLFFSSRLIKTKRLAIKKLSKLTVVAPAQWLASKVQKIYPQMKVETVLNALDGELFVIQDKNSLRRKYNLPLYKKIVLFSAANLNDTNKNINFVINAAADMEKDEYLFVGLGSGGCLAAPNVIFLGYIVDERKLADIYLLSDIFCFLSKAETAPLSLLEARAAGLFVVTSNLEANQESLGNYQYKIMVEMDQLNKLSEYIKRAGISGVCNPEQTASLIDMCKQYLEIYQSNL